MAAHFGEKLGVSPARITQTRPARSEQPPFPGEDAEPPGLRDLPRRLRQIVDFLILYPEFFPELWSAGLDRLKSYAPLAGFLAILHELAAKERLTPENIFSALPEGAERRYVARLFMEAARTPPEEDGGPGTMCEELIRWLDEEKLQSREAELLERIREAQAKGDSTLLMELLREKQECGRKRSDFCDNLLKNK
jgi:hypothetical protein